ncbi:MarR family winged helix-turn-helix transcriptional regulator [Nonomuraea gerenzanensis]|uniref:Transcriptional regulator, MarR family n=1 Tax=Nonomuraea gerenzanensis TaxID=93944 RepID=A0A1M4EE26_9ACTN|nr:MarR family transcriptional regulator [Nonomuraea gerenzanensis]UBU08663.1 MarR family transcriptional regulator [Nonomuraea gerenzanensis]SBO97024.1 Transcriptional regulator, MarR family [Nonomuraea gerenzanensis]
MNQQLTAEAVAPRLRGAVLRLARRLRVDRDRSALSNNKIAVLSHLIRAGESTPSRVSRDERQHPQSLTRVFAELVQDGLIERVVDPDDGRRSRLRLTGAGRAAFEHDMALRDRWLAAALDGLSPAELRLLADAARLLDRIGAPGDE